MVTYGPAPRPASERLAAKLIPAPNGCIEWHGAMQGGYGRIVVGSRRDGSRRLKQAHRLAWELARGAIPDGLIVCHACDNPPCCNVEHLFLGTHADNAADMDAKGRRVNTPHYGVENGRAVLDHEAVRRIRQLASTGLSQSDVARSVGIARTTVREVIVGMRWTGVA